MFGWKKLMFRFYARGCRPPLATSSRRPRWPAVGCESKTPRAALTAGSMPSCTSRCKRKPGAPLAFQKFDKVSGSSRRSANNGQGSRQLPTASVVRLSHATPTRHRGQLCARGGRCDDRWLPGYKLRMYGTTRMRGKTVEVAPVAVGLRAPSCQRVLQEDGSFESDRRALSIDQPNVEARRVYQWARAV